MNPNAHLADEHEAMALLLPWHVNHSLDEADGKRMRTHLRQCLTCRRELIALSPLADSVAKAPTLDFSAHTSYARFMRQLPPRRARRRPVLRVEAAALLLLALPLGFRQYGVWPLADFQTLADARPAQSNAAGDLRLVFARNLPAERIDALLREVGAKIVEGPNTAGAYAVSLGNDGEPADPGAVLAALRRQEGVLLAEPMLGNGGPNP